MKKTSKKLLTLALTLIMALALAIPTFAAEATYTLTINDDVSSHTYQAYQIFSGDYSENMSNLSNIQWGSGVNSTALLAALKADEELGTTFSDCESAEDVAAKLTQQNVVAFSKIVGENLSETSTNVPYVEANTNYSVTLEQGYYFVKQVGNVGTDEAYSDFIIQLVGDIAVDPKSTTVPDFDKQVGTETDDTASYNIGDDVPFTLTATMPESITSYDTYKLVFTDTFSAGLTYNNDVKVTVGGTGLTSEQFIANYDEASRTLTVTINDVKALGAVATTDVKVEYTAELNTNAVVGGTGNSNNAKLSYSNNPNSDSTGTTHTDEVTVFTFEMDGTKHNSDNEGLSGAWFVLSRTNNGQIEYATVDSTNNKVTGWTVTMPTM